MIKKIILFFIFAIFINSTQAEENIMILKLKDGDVVIAETAEEYVPPAEAWAVLADEAKVKGYEGEACTSCSQFTLVRNGSCLKCITCGETSGCS